MKRLNIISAAAALCAVALCANAQNSTENKETAKEHLQNHYKFYGFIRNYFAYDSHESKSGTGDLYYWLPTDRSLNAKGEDMAQISQFRFLAITSRVGVDVSGYQVGRTQFGAKVEADFYCGLDSKTSSGAVDRVSGTATLRLRQAYATLKWAELGLSQQGSIAMKIGQAWHPMAADLPDIFSLESAAPFGPFSRTPQVTADFNFNSAFGMTASLIWQMQYKSAGPEGASANYIKYSCTPEVYFGLNYKSGGFLGRVGVDLLSIKPRNTAVVGGTTVKVKDRITTLSPYIYLQYTKDLFKFKAKSIFASAGEHINLMSGYAVASRSDDMQWEYTPYRTSSTWATFAYGKKIQGAMLLGYIKNLGTEKDIVNVKGTVNSKDIYFQANGSASISSMFRIQPEVTYNIGKFTVGLEYMLTAVQYCSDKNGSVVYNVRGLSKSEAHWVLNNRIQAMVKFTF